jgi:hypothetical protein
MEKEAEVIEEIKNAAIETNLREGITYVINNVRNSDIAVELIKNLVAAQGSADGLTSNVVELQAAIAKLQNNNSFLGGFMNNFVPALGNITPIILAGVAGLAGTLLYKKYVSPSDSPVDIETKLNLTQMLVKVRNQQQQANEQDLDHLDSLLYYVQECPDGPKRNYLIEKYNDVLETSMNKYKQYQESINYLPIGSAQSLVTQDKLKAAGIIKDTQDNDEPYDYDNYDEEDYEDGYEEDQR